MRFRRGLRFPDDIRRIQGTPFHTTDPLYTPKNMVCRVWRWLDSGSSNAPNVIPASSRPNTSGERRATCATPRESAPPASKQPHPRGAAR